jgi:transcriptional regulator with XRE-family HTH domain
MNYTIKTIAELLTAARKRKRLTQVQLAELLSVPQSYVARIEAGSTDLRSSKLIEIAKFVDLEIMFIEKQHVKRVELVIAEDDYERFEQDQPAYVPDESDDDDKEIY